MGGKADNIAEGIGQNANIQDFNIAWKLLEFVDFETASNNLLSLLQEFPVPVWAYNKNGEIIFWNKSCENSFGYPSFTILNENDPLGLSGIKGKPHETIELEKKVTTLNGKHLILQLFALQKKFQSGETQTWFFANDITAIKVREAELNERLTHLSNLEHIFNQSDSVAYIRENDIDWSITYISSNISKFGFKAEEFTSGKIPYASLIHPDDVAKVKAEVLVASHQHNQKLRIEYRILPPNSDPIWVSDVFEFKADQKGAIKSFQGVITDITNHIKAEDKIIAQNKIIQDRNQELYIANDELTKTNQNIYIAHKKLTESEEKFKLISEQSLLGILIIKNSEIVYVNESMSKASGYSRDELMNLGPNGFYKLIHPDDLPLSLERIEYLYNSPLNEATQITFRGISKKGEVRWYQKWTKIVMFEGEKALLITILDIDEVKRWQDRLTENENQLKAKLDFILSPGKSDFDIRLTDIFDVEQLQKIQDAFADSHQVASIITDQHGNPITNPSNFSTVCKMIRSTHAGRELCRVSDKIIGERSKELLKPYSTTCLSCGFIDAGAPIIVGGKHIGTWMVGHSMKGSASNEALKKVAQETGLDPDQLHLAYHKMKFIGEDQFDNVVNFLWLLAKEISALGYNNAKLARDVEERKKIERELIRAKNKAVESDRLKSAFLANMSHEIRTPMNAILGFANLLEETENNPDTQKEYIEIINQNGNQLLKLIDDILDIAKIEAGQINIVERPCQLDLLMFDQFRLFKTLAEKNTGKSIEILLNIPGTDHCTTILTDQSRLNQVLTNLISNAYKFTDYGSIELGYTFENKWFITFFVKDTGIGLPKEKQALVFDRFRQADETQARKYGGTGLGLTISNNLVLLMGGKMWVESEINQGSIFYFTLPYKPVINSETSSETKKKETDRSVNFNWNGKKILIAEDEDINFLYLNEIIKNTGAEIIRAKNGAEAIYFCKNNSEIDIVLMDMKMPEINGYEATREIKKIRENLPVIAQTAHAMEEEKEKCLEYGCNDYLAKPIERKQLLLMLEQYIHHSYLHE